MAGRDQSAQLQGLLSGIAGDIGEMSKGGEWTGNAIRNLARPDQLSGMLGRPKFDMNNVDNLNSMAGWASRNGYDDQARQYAAQSAMQQEKQVALAKQARLQEGQASVADMSRKMMSILKDPTLSPAESEAQLNALQESAIAISQTVPGMNPTEVGNLRTNVEKSWLSSNTAKQQIELREEQNEREWRQDARQTVGLELSEEEAVRSQAKHNEWTQTADYRETQRQLKLQEGAYNQALNAAKGMAGTEGGKEKFLSLTKGLYEGVYDSVEAQKTAQNLQIEEAQARVDSGKFTYKVEDIVAMGIPEEYAKQIHRIGTEQPGSGNAMVLTGLKAVLGKAKAPTGALIDMFKEAALAYGRTLDFKGWDSEQDEENYAMEMQGKMSAVYMETGSIEQALQVPSMMSAQKEVDSSGDEFNDLANELKAIMAAQSDATDPDG